MLLAFLGGYDKGRTRRGQVVGEGGTVSVQVLNEVANVAWRKMKMDWTETREFLALIRGVLHVEPLNEETHETALDLVERYRLSVYDALIVASALLAGFDRLMSEDMQSGQTIDGSLTIIDPFSVGL